MVGEHSIRLSNMAKQPTEPVKKSSPKTAKASKKPVHETHGALPAVRPPMNMMKAFGIKDGYDTDDKTAYAAQIEDMTNEDLHTHAHEKGVVPLDARDKLKKSLLNKFDEVKLSYLPPRVRHVPQNPAMAGFMKKFLAGEA